MIPLFDEDFLYEDDEVEEEVLSGLTFKMNPQTKRIESSLIDEKESVKQWIDCILRTERDDYEMYSEDYGTELNDIIGEPYEIACAEIEDEIADALSVDDRIESVDNFEFERDGNAILVTFDVYTEFGTVSEEMEVY